MIRALAMTFLAAAVTPAFAQEGDWIQLFNGKDLSGWKLNENGKIKVEDGLIKISGERSHLFTDREFGDFIFEADVKTTPGSNSGIYFHTKYQEQGWPEKGHEIQVNVSHADPVKSGSLYNRVKIFKTPMKDNEWARYRVTVKGDTVRTEINEIVLYEYVQPPGVSAEPMIGKKGQFALQAHDPNSVVYYRNIRVKPLGESSNN